MSTLYIYMTLYMYLNISKIINLYCIYNYYYVIHVVMTMHCVITELKRKAVTILKAERDKGVYVNEWWTYIPQHKAEPKEEDDREDGEDTGNSHSKQHAQLVLAGCSVVCGVWVYSIIMVFSLDRSCLQVCAQVFYCVYYVGELE